MLPLNDAIFDFLARCRRLCYVRTVDTLYIFVDFLEEGIVRESGGNFVYRMTSDGTRVLAVEIHNFRRIVLRENAALAKAWRAYRSPMRRLLRRLVG